jgi:hypothetical protein
VTSGDRDVDIDLLADYAGGALDGTPAHARVAELVHTDPAWASALDALRTADALVGADLAGLAGAAEPIPDDVAARLDRALAVAEQPVAPVVSLRERRRRRYRIAAAGAVAAAVLGVVGVGGYAVLGTGGAGRPSYESGAAESDTAAAPSAERNGAKAADGRLPNSSVPVTASGTDYTRKTLSGVRDNRAEAPNAAPVRPPSELSRLTAADALQECLTDVTAAYPGNVTLVDYARFEGEAALVIRISAAHGVQRVVVVGPGCGSSGTDEKYATVD